MDEESLPLISVVVTGYRRPDLLARTVESLLARISYPRERLELILCDDGSSMQEQAEMMTLPFDDWLLATKNEGLGRNTNKGILRARGSLILHLQDDWLCIGPSDFLPVAVQLLDERPDIAMVRFHPIPDPELVSDTYMTASGHRALLLKARLFERTGQYAYTDNPHLKRRSVHERLGMYRENVPMTTMEIDFCKRVNADSETVIAFIEGYDSFLHLGQDRSFNPTRLKRVRKIALLRNPLTRWPLILVLYLKKRIRLGRRSSHTGKQGKSPSDRSS
jgi:glycosyltransferase involved in cell wall biosynthesis